MKLANIKITLGFLPLRAKILLLNLFSFFAISSFAQSISVTSVATTPVCAGTSVTITFSTTNGTGGSNRYDNNTVYTIYLSNSSGGSYTSQGTFSTTGVTYSGANGGITSGITRSFTVPAGTSTGTGYRISLGSTSPTFNGSGGAGASAAFTVNARPTSVISGTAIICNGGSTTLSVALTGTQPWSLTYFDGTTSTPITGITTSPYTFNVSPNSARTYTVTALSDANCTSIGADRTGSAVITVNPTPTLTGASQPAAACSGSSATINLTGLLASSTSTVSYSINSVAQTPVTNVVANGSGAASFSTTTLTSANNGQTLQITGVTITSASPNCSASFTQNVTLSVNPSPTLSGASQAATVCSGLPATINLTGLLASSISTISYSINSVAQTPVAGVTANGSGDASFSTVALTPANNNQTLRITGVTVTSSTPNCSAVFTQDVLLSVNTGATISLDASASSVCFDAGTQTTSLGYSGTTGTPLTYSITWNASPTNSFAAVTDAALPVSPITIDIPAGANAGTYTGNLTVTNGIGCVSAATSFTVTVNPLPTLTGASQSAAVCGGSSATINLTGLVPSSTSTISYTINGAAQTPVAGVTANGSGAGNFPTTALTTANNGQTLQITGITITSASPNCAASFIQDVILNVNPSPTLSGATQSSAACAGSGALINLTGLLANSTSTVSYSINSVAQTPVTNVIADGSGAASFTSANLTTANNGQTLQITGVTRTDVSPNCTQAFTQNVTLSVIARPTSVISGTASICAGASTNISIALTGTQPWSLTYFDGTTSTPVTGITTSPYVVSVSPASTRTYTVTALSDANCTSQAGDRTGSAVITVNALPTITHAAAATSVCYGTTSSSLTYSATTNTPNQYSITWNASPTNTLATVTNAALSVAPSSISIAIPANHPGGTFTGNLTVRNSTTGCVSTTTQFTLTIFNDVTGLSATATAAQCSNAGITVTLSSSRLATGTYNVSYQFNNSGSTSNATVAFTAGSPGTGTFTTVAPSVNATTVTIKTVSIATPTCASGTLTINTNSFTVSAPPNAASNNLTTSASGTNTGNLLGSTVTIIASQLTIGTYTIGYTVTDQATNSIVYINSTQSVTFVTAIKKGNRIQGSFTTGQLINPGTYRVNINSITSQTTGCTANISGEFAIFSVVSSISTTGRGNGLWDGTDVWSSNPTGGDGPDYTAGPITINHQVTYDATATSLLLELDQLTIGATGELIIASGQEFRVKNGTGVDITIVAGGKLTIGSTTLATGDPYNGTLVFETGVDQSGTNSTFVTFRTRSLYQHLNTSTNTSTLSVVGGAPPLATWAADATISVEGYTSSLTLTSTNWSQNFGKFEWNCSLQTGDINLNGLLGASPTTAGTLQGDVNIVSTGSGILRFGESDNGSGTDYVLTIPGTLTVSNPARFSAGPTNGNGPDAIFNLGNFTYSSTGTSWFCDAGQTTVNISGNMVINNTPGVFYFSDSGGNRSGTTVNLAGDLTVSANATLGASSSNNGRKGTLIFNNLPGAGAAKTHLFTVGSNGSITQLMMYQITANQTVRTVDESAFMSIGTAAIGGIFPFTMDSDSKLIVESTHADGAIQSGTVAGNIRVADTGRSFANGSSIEFNRTSPAAQFIGIGHPTTVGVNCIINNSLGVTVSAGGVAGGIQIGGELQINSGNLNVTNRDLTITQDAEITGGNLVFNTSSFDVTPQTALRTITFNGAINFIGVGAVGQVQVTSGANNTSNAILQINGNFLGANFFTFSGANCRVLIGGVARTFSRPFPISGQTTLEYLNMDFTSGTVTTLTTLEVPQNLTLGNTTGANDGGLTLTDGNLDMNADLLVTTDVSLINGILYFENRNVEIRRNITPTNATGLFSSNSVSTLSVTSNFNGLTADFLLFTPTGNTLGTLTLNRSVSVATRANLLINTPVNIANFLYLTDGQFLNQSGLNMLSGSTIVRTPQAEFYNDTVTPIPSATPTGGAYNVIYNNYSVASNTLTTGVEISGSLNDVTSNLTGTATLNAAMTGIGAFTITAGAWTSGINAISMASLLNDGALTAPSSTLTLTGTVGPLFGNFTNNNTFTHNSGTVIFNGTSTISGSSITDFYFLTLNANRTLTGPAHMRVNGHINFGTDSRYNHSNGNVELTNGVSQNITANNLEDAQTLSMTDVTAPGTSTFYRLTVNKTAGTTVTLQTPVQLGRLLDIQSATNVISNGNLILLSNTKSTAWDAGIGPLAAGADVTGAVQAQRFMGSTAYALFRYMASPVVNGAIPAASVNKLYRYDPTISTTNTNLNWVRNFGTMPVGEGYAALTYVPSDTRWSVTGLIQKGPHTWTWTNLQAGWNLIGNPFPSAIRWENFGGVDWTLNNVSTTIGITDNNVSGYPSYFRYLNAPIGQTWGTGTIENRVIAMGQAFWVYVGTGGASLTINESAKVSATELSLQGQFYRKSSLTSPLVLSINNGKFGDQTFLKIDNGSEELTLDSNLPKLWNPAMNIYLVNGSGLEMLTYTLRDITEGMVIPVGLKVSEPGEYEISFENFEVLNHPLYLIDLFEGEAVPVSSELRYKITVRDVLKPLNSRFYLSLSPEIEYDLESSVSVYPNPIKNNVSIQVMGSKDKSEGILMDSKGNVLSDTYFTLDGSIDMANYPDGMYILKIRTSRGIVTKKIAKHD